MKSMAKIDELTDLKAIAIFMLFFVHSNLLISAHAFTVPLEQWMLATFFFISGYLTFTSFCHRRRSIRVFTKHRFIELYIPFVAIMAFYVLTDSIVYFSPAGFLTHASFLSLFAVFAEGPFAMYQFWFIPELLAFSILYVVFAKYVDNSKVRFAVLGAVLAVNAFAYAFALPFRLEYNVGLYLAVFAFGYEISDRKLIDRIRSMRWTLFPLLGLTVLALFASTYLLNWDLSTFQARAVYFPAVWLDVFALAVPSSIIAIVLLNQLHMRISEGRGYAIIGAVASSSLFMYLLEGYVSPLVGRVFFGAGWYITDISGPLLLPSILLRVILVFVIAYPLEKGYSYAVKRLSKEKLELNRGIC